MAKTCKDCRFYRDNRCYAAPPVLMTVPPVGEWDGDYWVVGTENPACRLWEPKEDTDA